MQAEIHLDGKTLQIIMEQSVVVLDIIEDQLIMEMLDGHLLWQVLRILLENI